MNSFLKELLSSKGTVSSTRVAMFLCLIFAFIIAIIGLSKGNDLGSVAVLVSAFITPAFANKTIQSFAEKKGKDNEQSGPENR